jgi:hypothetical protein
LGDLFFIYFGGLALIELGLLNSELPVDQVCFNLFTQSLDVFLEGSGHHFGLNHSLLSQLHSLLAILQSLLEHLYVFILPQDFFLPDFDFLIFGS